MRHENENDPLYQMFTSIMDDVESRGRTEAREQAVTMEDGLMKSARIWILDHVLVKPHVCDGSHVDRTANAMIDYAIHWAANHQEGTCLVDAISVIAMGLKSPVRLFCQCEAAELLYRAQFEWALHGLQEHPADFNLHSLLENQARVLAHPIFTAKIAELIRERGLNVDAVPRQRGLFVVWE
jgi:hypothetical protein